MPRTWSVPEGDTLHLIGDLHFNKAQSGYTMGQTRADKLKADVLESKLMPSVAARLQIGDFTDVSASGENTTANAWAVAMGGPFYGVVGNHDLWNVRTPQTAVDAFTSWTNRTSNWTADLGFVQLIGIGPGQHTPVASDMNGLLLDQVALDYLDSTLAAATKDCVVMCHAPMTDTVLASSIGNEANEYTTRAAGPDPGMQVTYEVGTTKTLPGILNTRARAKVILSGHTHSYLDAQDLLKVHSVGSRNVLAINASAPVYQGKPPDFPGADPIYSFFLTFPGGEVQVRVRDHGSRCWTGIGTSKVTALTVPA